jgi:DNA mismatch repair protein MLH3
MHGRHGQFLASLSALSLLSISSRHSSEQSENNIVYHHSEVLFRHRNVSEEERRVGGRNGTRLVVRDLFGNLAVRIKQRAIQFGSVEHVQKELDHLKSQIAAIVLAWPKPVRIVVTDQQSQQRRKFTIGTRVKLAGRGHRENPCSQRMSAFRLDHVCAILSHAGYIMPTDFGSWTSVSARTSQMFVRAAICLKPGPSKFVQFISLDIHPLDSSSNLNQVLCREVNNLFAESDFATFEDPVDTSEEERLRKLKDGRFTNDGYTDRQLKRRGKGADRWPMFYIRIEARGSDVPAGVVKGGGDDTQAAKFLEKTVQLIRSMLHQFLKERHFRPGTRRQRNGRQSVVKGSTANEPALDRRAERPCPPQPTEVSQLVPENHDGELSCSPTNVFSDKGQGKFHKVHSAILFSSWSRIKTAKLHALDDLVSGLPRSKLPQGPNDSNNEPVSNVKYPASHDSSGMPQSCPLGGHLDEDVHLLLQDLVEDFVIESGNHQENVEAASEARVAEPPEGSHVFEPKDPRDGIIVWKNPMSGNIIRINSRTGLSMPHLSPHALNEPGASTASISARLSSNIRASFRENPLSLKANTESLSESHSWLGNLLGGWQNPVFRLQERPIPSVALENVGRATAMSYKCHHGKHDHCAESQAAGRDGRLSKAALAGADIHGQVDKKFILVTMKLSGTETVSESSQDHPDSVLVLIDQHAADERCRVESLYGAMRVIKPTNLPKPIVFEVTEQEMELFRREQGRFEPWGILYNWGADQDLAEENTGAARPASADMRSGRRLVDVDRKKRPATAASSTRYQASSRRQPAIDTTFQIAVHALPELIAERCRLHPELLIDVLRTEVWVGTGGASRTLTLPPVGNGTYTNDGNSTPAHPWLKYISSCPRGIIDLVNSRACRSAIMFNDVLTKAECEELVKKLAKCAFPFQCAHGRPSMIVLGGLGPAAVAILKGGRPRTQPTGNSVPLGDDHTQTFLRAFRTWQQ